MADLTLKKKTCLITGASGAIGGAIANKLSSEELTVGIDSVNTPQLKEKILW